MVWYKQLGGHSKGRRFLPLKDILVPVILCLWMTTHETSPFCVSRSTGVICLQVLVRQVYVLLRYYKWHSLVISRRHNITGVLLVPWLLKSFFLFWDVPWPLGVGCIVNVSVGARVPYNHLFPVFWLVVVFLHSFLSASGKNVYLMRNES